MHWLHPLRRALGRTKPAPAARRPAPRAVLRLESLDGRIVPAVLSGNAWPNSQLVTISFIPDGTLVGNNTNGLVASNLFATLNARFGSPAAWQTTFLKAAESWAAQTNLNFALVADDGLNIGSGQYQQGDPGHGDIRISGYNFGNTNLGTTFMPPPVNNQDLAGEMKFNTGVQFNNGSTYDLYSVAAHEFGHSLGLYHSNIASSTMYGAYAGVKNSLTADDIGGIRQIYSNGAARSADAFDAAAANNTAAAATDLTSFVDPGTNTALVGGLDITTAADVDWYMIGGAVPTTTNTLTVTAQSKGLSLLAPTLTVYAADKTTVLGTATAGTTGFSSTLSLTVNNVGLGSPVYIKVAGVAGSAFSTGAYALTLNTGTNASPVVTPPNTSLLNGSDPSAGGGTPIKVATEQLANTTTAGVQTFAAGNSAREVAMDASGNFIVVWASQNQDGAGWGVYAQRYNADGTKNGGEVRVNTYTLGDQVDPTVTMSASGYAVVVWASKDEDGNGWGIFGQVFAPDGSRPGNEFRINSTILGDQTSPSVGIDASGTVTYTWTSNNQDGDKTGVYMQRYNAYGFRIGFETRVNTTTAKEQTGAQVAVAANGSFVVTWQSNGQDGDKWGIYAQRYNADGTKAGAEFRVNTTTAGDQNSPSVGIDPNGNFVIAWVSVGQDGDKGGVFAQRYKADGTKVGGEFQANVFTTGDQLSPQVTMDATGMATIIWSSNNQDYAGWSARGAQFSAAGDALGGEFSVPTAANLPQQSPSVVMDALGHMVIAWSGGTGPASDGIYFQRFDTTGNQLAVYDNTNPFGETAEDQAGLKAYLDANGIDLYPNGIASYFAPGTKIDTAPTGCQCAACLAARAAAEARTAPAAVVEPSAVPVAVAAVGSVPAAPAAVAGGPAAFTPATIGGHATESFAVWMSPAGTTLQTAAATPAAGEGGRASDVSFTSDGPAAALFHYDGWYYAAGEPETAAEDAWAEDKAPDMIVAAADEAAEGNEWNVCAAVVVE